MALSRNEIQALQRKNKLNPDGIIGPRTQRAIDADILERQIAKQNALVEDLKRSVDRALVDTIGSGVEQKRDTSRLNEFRDFFENRWKKSVEASPNMLTALTQGTPSPVYEGKRVSYNANIPKRDTAYLVDDGAKETLFVSGRRMGKTELNTQILENLIKNASDADIKRYLSGEMKLDIRGPINSDGVRGLRADQLIMDEYANVDPRTYQYLIRPGSTDTVKTTVPKLDEDQINAFMEALKRSNDGAIIVPSGTDVQVIQAVYVDPCEPYSLVDFIEEG